MPVDLIVVGTSSKGTELVFPGRVKAREEISLPARATGRLTRLPRQEGERFRAGEPLALFEAPEMRQSADAAEAALRAATMRRDLARVQGARVESLFATRVASRRDLELAESDIASAESDWAGAAAAASTARTASAIPAPFDGVVTRRLVDIGQVVSAGQPVLEVRSSGSSEIETPVPESAIDGTRGARIEFQLDEGPWHEARLLRLDGMTDFTTRTRMAHLLPIEGAVLEPGRFVRVRFSPAGTAVTPPAAERGAAAAPAGERAALESQPLAVPASSLVRRGALAGVYVIADGRAELRWLRVGRATGRSVEVLTGLWPGERIAANPEGLSDAAPVRVRP